MNHPFVFGLFSTACCSPVSMSCGSDDLNGECLVTVNFWLICVA